MKKFRAAMVLGLILTMLWGNVHTVKEQTKHLQDSVLRLHILANSDSPSDQDLKLQVRDALLAESDNLFRGCRTLEEMQQRAIAESSTIRLIAKTVLERNGCDDDVQVQLVQMQFDKKQYEEITMPAGAYSALRILIGKAEGHNWWCVMYPPLCIPAVSQPQTAEEWFDAETCDLLEHPERYEIRFKCVEWMEKLHLLESGN